MAATALNVKGEKMVVITTVDPVGLVVQVYKANDNYEYIGEPESFVRSETEEEFHRGLRKDAKEKDQFIENRSTNPEWNPE